MRRIKPAYKMPKLNKIKKVKLPFEEDYRLKPNPKKQDKIILPKKSIEKNL